MKSNMQNKDQDSSYQCHYTANQNEQYQGDECIVTRKSNCGVVGWSRSRSSAVVKCVFPLHLLLHTAHPSAACTSADTFVRHSVDCRCCHSHRKALLFFIKPNKAHKKNYRRANKCMVYYEIYNPSFGVIHSFIYSKLNRKLMTAHKNNWVNAPNVARLENVILPYMS